MKYLWIAPALLCFALIPGCGGNSSNMGGGSGGSGGNGGSGGSGGTGGGGGTGDPGGGGGGVAQAKIQHLVIIMMQNHS
ncbi:MAG: hypothetical protein ACRD3F_02300, partial [Acidobacteriaceae bacterium]